MKLKMSEETDTAARTKPCAVCVGITVCSLCGYNSVLFVWVSQCAVCVSITVCSLCGYQAVLFVWVS